MKDKKKDIYSTNLTLKYECLKDKCWDDCCSYWTVEVLPHEYNKLVNLDKSLADCCEPNPYRPNDTRMKLVGEQKKCINLDSCGLCKIHSNYGQEYLPDICNYFPQTYKAMNESVFLDVSTACPKGAEIKLFANPEDWKITKQKKETKKNGSLLNYLKNFGQTTPDDAVKIFEKFLMSIFKHKTALESLGFLIFCCNELDKIRQSKIKISVNAIINKGLQNTYKTTLLNEDDSLRGKISFVIQDMLDKEAKPFEIAIRNDIRDLCTSEESFEEGLKIWNKVSTNYDKIIQNFICGKLSEIIFPFGGYYSNYISEAKVIYVQSIVSIFSLIAKMKQTNREDLTSREIVEIIQCIDREFYAKSRNRVFESCEKSGIF